MHDQNFFSSRTQRSASTVCSSGRRVGGSPSRGSGAYDSLTRVRKLPLHPDLVEALVPDLARIAVVMLDFPKYTDGRAYSQARLLRERHGYRGELRATGNVLRDQLLLMRRCGFDAYEVDARGAAGFAAAMGSVTHAYQPATNDAGMFLKRYKMGKRATS